MPDFFFLILAVFGYMNLWFLVSLFQKRNDVADIAWGPGFILLAWMSFYLSDSDNSRAGFTNLLVSLWGLRLAAHIYIRNKGKGEDFRYLAWRKEWGKWFYLRSWLQVYMLQGSLLLVIATPVLLINLSGVSTFPAITDYIGFLVWLTGFFFELVGDAQLMGFMKNPENKGKLMQNGLWQYTRHPNYFGEVVLWWGIGIIALGIPYGWAGLIGPLMISFLILKVSGIPMLEKGMEKHKDFPDYKKSVNAFFPWFPAKNLNDRGR